MDQSASTTPPGTAGSTTPVTRPAPTDHDILAAIRERWSPRAFDPQRPVTRKQLAHLFEAARWAPSSSNVQPWRYLVFDTAVSDARDRMRDCLADGNAWARRAPVLVLSVVLRWWPDSRDPNPSALHDVGAASMALTLQATADRLVAHQIAGYDRDCARRVAELPDGADPVALIAIGHPGQVVDLDQALAQRERAERSRRPVRESVHVGRWTDAAFRPSSPVDR